MTEKIIRVFPTKTSMSPIGGCAFYGLPPFKEFLPEHDEVHISVVFTWDKLKAGKLILNWQGVTNKPVKIGGPAYDDPGDEFITGMYLKKGITITSRGCPNNCQYCFVYRREGDIRELPIAEGNIIQDNNFLACSKIHRQKVYDMLRSQKSICFKGGLQAKLINSWDVEQLRSLRIKELWLACDSHNALLQTVPAIQRLLQAGFKQNHIRCYVLIGFDMEEEQNRLKQLLKAGCLPFAQLYQPEERIEYDYKWREFSRVWSRPAIYRTTKRDRYARFCEKEV